jgi:hypothetical protein
MPKQAVLDSTSQLNYLLQDWTYAAIKVFGELPACTCLRQAGASTQHA